MPNWDDLDAFVDTADFAVAATITPAAGGRKVVPGIYDEKYLDAALGEYVEETTRPRFTCKEADVTGIKRGDAICIPGQGEFHIMTGPQTDGTGMAVLDLTPA